MHDLAFLGCGNVTIIVKESKEIRVILSSVVSVLVPPHTIPSYWTVDYSGPICSPCPLILYSFTQTIFNEVLQDQVLSVIQESRSLSC